MLLGSRLLGAFIFVGGGNAIIADSVIHWVNHRGESTCSLQLLYSVPGSVHRPFTTFQEERLDASQAG